jgi:DNA-binding transcriptional ArsR family regulator
MNYRICKFKTPSGSSRRTSSRRWHPTRIAIVELLRNEGEVPVSRIQRHICIEQANASQHLAILRGRLVISSRKEGNQVFYQLRDARLGEVFDLTARRGEGHAR